MLTQFRQVPEIRSGAAEGGGWGEEFRRAFAPSQIMKSKHTNIKILLLIISTIVVPNAFVYAHLETHSPYGYDPYRTELNCSFYNNYQNIDVTELARKRECEISSEIGQKAVENKDKNICNQISDAYNKEFNNGKTYPFGSALSGGTSQALQENIEGAITNCYRRVGATSVIKPTPLVEKFDRAIFFVTSLTALIYLFLILWLRNIRGRKLWGMSLLFQVLMFIFVGAVGFVANIGFDRGPVIASLHDLLFFQQTYLQSIIITGVVTSILTFILALLLLLFFRKDFSLSERTRLALFYTLVFNPFFFPAGQVVGLIHLIYTRSIAQKIRP